MSGQAYRWCVLVCRSRRRDARGCHRFASQSGENHEGPDSEHGVEHSQIQRQSTRRASRCCSTVKRTGRPAGAAGPAPRGGCAGRNRAGNCRPLRGDRADLTQLQDEEAGIVAVGHRVVHGGPVFTTSVRVTAEVKAGLAALAELAPLHNPINLEGIERRRERLARRAAASPSSTPPFTPRLSAAARTYPCPRMDRGWGLRRYGFHGLSHAYCAGRAARCCGADVRLVICHLGQGCSVSAVRAGVCVDTSMGFTPLDGLMMGTRSGSVDPGLLIYVLRHRGLTADDLDRVLNRESGLLGVSGVSNDMRQVQAAAAAGNAPGPPGAGCIRPSPAANDRSDGGDAGGLDAWCSRRASASTRRHPLRRLPGPGISRTRTRRRRQCTVSSRRGCGRAFVARLDFGYRHPRGPDHVAQPYGLDRRSRVSPGVRGVMAVGSRSARWHPACCDLWLNAPLGAELLTVPPGGPLGCPAAFSFAAVRAQICRYCHVVLFRRHNRETLLVGCSEPSPVPRRKKRASFR